VGLIRHALAAKRCHRSLRAVGGQTAGGTRHKIAYLWPHHVGMEKSATYFQRPIGLTENFDIHFLTRAESRIPAAITARVQLQRAPTVRKLFSGPAFLLFAARWLGKNRFRLSAVYTTGGTTVFIGWFARRFLSLRWMAEFWDHPFLERNYARQNGRRAASLFHHLRSLATCRMTRRADVVVCTGNAGMLRPLRVAQEKLVVLPNGADASVFRPHRSRRPATKLAVVYVGWIGRARGAALMFDAMQLLKSIAAPVTLTMIGPFIPHDREWILGRQQQLEGFVSLTGRLAHAEVPPILANSTLGLYPFPKEEELEFIYPIKVYEYMAMGVVPVCTHLTGTRDILQDGVDGFLLKSNEPGELTSCLIEAARNPKRIAEMSVAARERAELFRWDRIHARLNAELAARLGATAPCSGSLPGVNAIARFGLSRPARK
jgi:glycosyltransferase involved in cell wall biosynthesis